MSLSERVTKIEREHDVYRFYLDGSDEKCYVYDLAKREIVGISGKTLKHTPSNTGGGLMAWLGNVVCNSWYNPNYRNREYIDRIITNNKFTAEVKLQLAEYFLETNDRIENYNWKEMLKDFQRPDFLKMMVENNSYRYAKGYEVLHEACEKYGFPYDYMPIGYMDASEIAECLKEKIIREDIKSAIKKFDNFKKALESFYTVLGTSDIRLIRNLYGTSMPDDNDIQRQIVSCAQTTIYQYREIRRLLAELEITDYKITSIPNDLEYLKVLKEERRQAKYNELFAKRQTEHNLNFEDENYKIFVPMEYKDCAKIGNYFHNCAGGYEWNNYLISNYRDYRHLVVVVEKSTDKYKVCTDIDNRKLDICQYLVAHNQRVEDKNLLEFREKYQKYLHELMEKGE